MILWVPSFALFRERRGGKKQTPGVCIKTSKCAEAASWSGWEHLALSLYSPSCGAELPPSQGRALARCVDAQRVSLTGSRARGTLQLGAGGVGSSVTKPQRLTAVFVKSNRNGPLLPWLCVKPQLLGRAKN